jgi:D-sedoheptulose 7-phosphate isomerase
MIIEDKILESILVKQKILADKSLIERIDLAAKKIIECYRNGGKVFVAGNGGSAADAQHIVCELVGRFYINRKGLAAEALSTNTSSITAISNDFDFAKIFSRQLEANAKRGDIFIGISTSGNSGNIIEALKVCSEIGVFTIGLTGESGGKMKYMCNILINVPSNDTPRIQEAHILIAHIICEVVERELFENEN